MERLSIADNHGVVEETLVENTPEQSEQSGCDLEVDNKSPVQIERKFSHFQLFAF